MARHAGVDRAAATCTMESARLRSEVADDATGFDVGAVPAGKSSGLAGMEERARSTGGRLWVHSTRGRGTTVVACCTPTAAASPTLRGPAASTEPAAAFTLRCTGADPERF